MGNEYGNEFELWPGRYESPDEGYHLYRYYPAPDEYKESSRQLFKRLGLTVLVSQIERGNDERI